MKTRDAYYKEQWNREKADLYISELEEMLNNSEESEKDLSKLLIECKHRIEELEAEVKEHERIYKVLTDDIEYLKSKGG